MPKLSESSNFYAKVYDLVKTIPYGKVSTYGAIAKALSAPSASRMVGYALNCAKDSDVPCHRVVNRFGALTGKIHFQNLDQMRMLLEAEGVRFKADGTVDLERHLHDFTA